MSDYSDELDDVFVQYHYNLFNQYLGRRVRIEVLDIKKRTKTFIGTLKGYDLHLNVVLADVYRVILNYTEKQRRDVEGLLLVRGSTVKTVTHAEPEQRLRPWPTKPRKPISIKKLHGKPPAPAPVTPPVTPTRPVKLKRSWLNALSPVSVLSTNLKDKSEEPGQEVTVKKRGEGCVEKDEKERGACRSVENPIVDKQESIKHIVMEPGTSTSAQLNEEGMELEFSIDTTEPPVKKCFREINESVSETIGYNVGSHVKDGDEILQSVNQKTPCTLGKQVLDDIIEMISQKAIINTPVKVREDKKDEEGEDTAIKINEEDNTLVENIYPIHVDQLKSGTETNIKEEIEAKKDPGIHGKTFEEFILTKTVTEDDFICKK